MIRRFLFCLFPSLFIAGSFVFGQSEANRVVPPAPTAANLGMYGQIPVGYFTGVPSIEVPIYTIQSGDLTLPVKLSYHVGSVKPNEIPGWVGMGFNLEAGGVITRIVKNVPDDLEYGFYNGLSVFNDELNDSLISEVYVTDMFERVKDGEPDLFMFNFDGHSGTFFIGNDGEIHLQSKQPIKIEMSIGDGGLFSAWTITTENGTRYIFAAGEKSEFEGTAHQNSFDYQYFSSWYLTQIESPVGSSISFYYTEQDSVTRCTESSFKRQGICGTIITSSLKNRVFHKGIFLKSISFSLGRLEFETVGRNDNYTGASFLTQVTAEDKKLSVIYLYNNDNELVKKWDFEYLEDNQRLKLQYLTESDRDGNSLPPYTFVYNEGRFPHSSLNFFNNYDLGCTDFWGYYNGAQGDRDGFPIFYVPSEGTGPGTVVGDVIRFPNRDVIFSETLEKIIYPTQGHTSFEWEPNDYSASASYDFLDYRVESAGSAHYKFVLECTSSEESCYYSNFDFDENTTVEFDKITLLQLEIVCQDCDDITNDSYARQADKWERIINPGVYTIDNLFRNPLTEILESHDWQVDTRNVDFIYNAFSIIEDAEVNLGGGLRIKSITNVDGVSNSLPVTKQFIYSDGGLSTGILNGFPQYEYGMDALQLYDGLELFFTCTMKSSEPMMPLPSGPVVTYSKVKEILNDSSYTEYYFTDHVSDPDIKPETVTLGEPIYDSGADGSLAWPFGAPGDLTPWIDNGNKRGLGIKEISYSPAGQMLNEVINTYTETQDESFDVMHIDILSTFFVRNSDASDASVSFVFLTRYPFQSSFVFKKSQITTSYSYDSLEVPSSFSVKKDFYYDNPTHLQISAVESTNSSGGVIREEMTYPADYSETETDDVIEALMSANMQTPVIQKTQFKVINGEPKVVSSAITTYKTNGMPRRLAQWEATSATALNDFYEFNPAVGYSGSQFKDRLEYAYTSFRIAQIKKDGFPISYLWGYKDRHGKISFPIAEIKNALVNEVFYEGFEDNGVLDEQSRTGTRCYAGDYELSLPEDFSLAPDARLSYWYWQDDQWNYKEMDYTGGSLILDDGEKIDDVRLYPATASMTTYTYNPFWGMTSSSDENSIPTYYEYDGFGRLIYIKDKNKDILKYYTYSFATPVAIWEPTGISFCDNGDLIRQEQDLNPLSSSYLDIRLSNLGATASCSEDPLWEETGVVLCFKDERGLNTGYQKHQEIDNNPLSDTYQQIRWVEDEATSSYCLNDATPVWEATGETRCLFDNLGHNTGYYQAEVADINLNSDTYGETVWEDRGYSEECATTQSYSISESSSQIECKTIYLRRTYDDGTDAIFEVRFRWDDLSTGEELEEIVYYTMTSGTLLTVEVCHNVGSYFEAELLDVHSISYEADWESTGTVQCLQDDEGAYTGYQQHEEQDINEYSNTYGDTRWVDDGMTDYCDPTPVWEETGETTCIRDSNGLTTGEQQHEEKDTAIHSPTYNQTQWVSDGTTDACLYDADPVWQATGETNCIKDDDGLATGEVEHEEQDINPNSETYNDTRWVSDGYTTDCSTDPTPVWKATGNEKCIRDSDGHATGEQQVEQEDINPNSETYGETRWVSLGTTSECSSIQYYSLKEEATSDFACRKLTFRRTYNDGTVAHFSVRFRYDDLSTGDEEEEIIVYNMAAGVIKMVVTECIQDAGSYIEIELLDVY